MASEHGEVAAVVNARTGRKGSNGTRFEPRCGQRTLTARMHGRSHSQVCCEGLRRPSIAYCMWAENAALPVHPARSRSQGFRASHKPSMPQRRCRTLRGALRSAGYCGAVRAGRMEPFGAFHPRPRTGPFQRDTPGRVRQTVPDPDPAAFFRRGWVERSSQAARRASIGARYWASSFASFSFAAARFFVFTWP